MIVDDHSEWRAFLRVIFGGDRTVIDCVSGEEAIARFETTRPDWVLMDVAMSPMDGLTATSRIKERFPDARIVCVSQYSDRLVREQALRSGAVAFVAKEEIWQLFEIIAPTGVSNPPSNSDLP